MGIAAIVLGVVALLAAIAAFIVSFVPFVGSFVGAFLAFAAPLLALVGTVLGGVALSRAREEGGETGVPMAGLIVSIVAFIPGFLVAISCGLCNSVCAAAQLESARNPRPTAPFWLDDAGAPLAPPPFSPSPSVPGTPSTAPLGDEPPPAFPPPPLEPPADPTP